MPAPQLQGSRAARPRALALPVGSVVLANARDLGAWYKARVLRADEVDGGAVLYTVQYETHRIQGTWDECAGQFDIETGVPESHVCALAASCSAEEAPASTVAAGEEKTHDIDLIVDCSGSMESLLASTVSGVNEFLAQQKAGESCRVGLHTFSDEVRCVWEGQPLRERPRVNGEDLATGGMTALLDAIGCTLSGKQHERPRLVCVVTDGHENSSRTWTHAAVKALIAKLEARGWDFLFLGANMDAVSAGGSLGFAASKCATWSPDAAGVQGAFGAAACSANRSRSVGKAYSGFSAAERAACFSGPPAGAGRFGAGGGCTPVPAACGRGGFSRLASLGSLSSARPATGGVSGFGKPAASGFGKPGGFGKPRGGFGKPATGGFGARPTAGGFGKPS